MAKTKKRNVANVDELKAYKVAYGQELGSKDYLWYVGAPMLIVAVYSFLMLYNVWFSFACSILGAYFGVNVLLPKSIKKQYEAEGFNQRNRFLNNITQVLTDDSQTVLMALQKVTIRSDGEFKENLSKFHAMLIGADSERIREAVLWFSDMYEDDLIFIQYIEQLETSLLEGNTNLDTLKDIKTYHNQIRGKQEEYEAVKKAHLKDMKTLAIVILVLIVSLSISFGLESYLEAFARSWPGYISVGLYMSVTLFYVRSFSMYYFDDSVMEVEK